jgi:Uma2 family endonuclease
MLYRAGQMLGSRQDVFSRIDRMAITTLRPITTDEYHQMIAAGIIDEGARIELILGQMYDMAAKGTRHTVATTELMGELLRLLGKRAKVRCQEPITLPNNSEPEPDLVIARLRQDNYLDSHPNPADLILVVEVADSSLDLDKNTKANLYAAAGIQEYWIINLVDDRLEVYRQPNSAIYTEMKIISAQASISLPQFPDITIDLTAIFPPPK